MGAGKNLRDEMLAPFPRDEHAVKVNRQEYYAIITHMDAQIGRILDALKKSGKADNTYIIFTSDHGLACGHHGLMGKQNMYEHSLRVPFIVTGPGVKAGAKIPRKRKTSPPIPPWPVARKPSSQNSRNCRRDTTTSSSWKGFSPNWNKLLNSPVPASSFSAWAIGRWTIRKRIVPTVSRETLRGHDPMNETGRVK